LELKSLQHITVGYAITTDMLTFNENK